MGLVLMLAGRHTGADLVPESTWESIAYHMGKFGVGLDSES